MSFLPCFLARFFVLGVLLVSFSSCTDQGCIEADDFGEYQTQIVTVPANATGDSCTYTPDKPLNDPSQGSGLQRCFTSGAVSIVDENGTTQSNGGSGGCSGFVSSATYRNICVENCRQICIASAGTGGGTPEPDWVSTSKKRLGQNIGVTITPGAEIYIRAVGTVVLGGDLSQPIFTRSTNYGLQSQDGNFSSEFYDLQKGVTKNIKFSGIWTNGSATIGGNAFSSDSAERLRAFNGLKRLVAYVIPHPAGYAFDIKNATSELSGIRGTPLFADTRLWECGYSGTVSTQSECASLPYNSNNGYGFTDNGVAQSLYYISTTAKADNLGKIGGMIRWSGDGLRPYTYDPYNGVTCTTNCAAPANPSEGGIVGSLASSGRYIQNNNNYAVRVSFKNLSGNSACDLSLTYRVSSMRPGDGYTNTRINIVSGSTVSVNSSGWSSYIDIEPTDQIVFEANASTFSSANCGTMIAYRFHKLHDIQITKSGFVSFTTLGKSGSSSSCTLKGRILNRGDIVSSAITSPVPGGSRLDAANDTSNIYNTVNFDGDFYEYDSFSASTSTDPLSNLSIPISNSPGLGTLYAKTWSNKFFVRKGQVIRLAPDSWNGTWTVGGLVGTRECGVGIAMKVGGIDYTTGQVDDRPAFLCRGTATESIPNPSCSPGAPDSSGNPTCQAYSETCIYDSAGNPGSNFCPQTSCQVSSPDSSCAVNGRPQVTIAHCQACAQAKADAGNPTTNPPTFSVDLDQCYDLEGYYGKVSNIPSGASTGFSAAQLANSQIGKGAAKIPQYNGTYGNFTSIADTRTSEAASFNSNKIYRLRTPLSANQNGRLVFLLLDNSTFDQSMVTAYNNNGSLSSTYNGLNGYKIDLSGRQEFKDGKWLEAILCKVPDPATATGDDNTFECSSSTRPTSYQLSTQPRVVELNTPTSTGEEPVTNSFYEFNPYGSIIRIADNGSSGGIEPSGGTFQTTVGDNFYRHSYDGSKLNGTTAENSDEEKAKRISRLRLTFKIKDPDILNCSTTAPALGQTSCTGNSCGLVTENKFYDSDVTGATNAICGANEPVNGNVDSSGNPTGCRKQFFCANPYYNNSGQYLVTVKVKNTNLNLSNIVDSVISPVVEIIDGKPATSTTARQIGQTERLYNQIVGDARFQAIIQIMVIMMITFYGVGYLMGVSEFSQSEIVIRVIKIGIIYLFIGPNGWVWFEEFFVNLFKNGTDYVTFLMASAFDKSTEIQNAIDNNDFYDKSILFGSIDKVFGLFLNPVVQKKIWALLFASVFGIVYLYIIYLGFFLYVYAVGNAVLLYLTAQIFISILFVVGPIFFIMLLFNQTKEMFDKWLSELIGFSLQQIFLLTTLAFFSMMMYEIIKMSLGYRICWDDVWIINTYVTQIKLLSFWTIASLPPKMNLQSDVANIGNPEGIPSIFSILFIWVIASLMHKFIDFMTNLGASIAGSLQVSGLGDGLKAAGGYMYKNAKKMTWDQYGGNSALGGLQSMDRALFDSGKKADEDRKKAKETLASDRKKTNTLINAGEKEVQEYKRTKASELARMGKADQEAKLKEIRNAAIHAKAKDIGLKGDELERILERKGSLTKGDSMTEMAYNAWRDRKIIGNDIKGRGIDARLSRSEFGALAKSSDDLGKQMLAEAARDGKIGIKSTMIQGARDELRKGAANLASPHKLEGLGQIAKGVGMGTAGVLGKIPGIQTVGGFIADRFRGAKAMGKDAMGTSNYMKAQAEMEADPLSGVDKMAKGTKWTRDSEQKEAISKRATEMEQEQKNTAGYGGVDSDTDAFIARSTGTKTQAQVDQERRNEEMKNSQQRQADANMSMIQKQGGSRPPEDIDDLTF